MIGLLYGGEKASADQRCQLYMSVVQIPLKKILSVILTFHSQTRLSF